MDSSVDELYQELLREHHKHPHNHGALSNASSSCLVHNPLCGDEIHVYLKASVQPNPAGLIEAVTFTGKGCSISQASASMMTMLMKGKSLAEARELIVLFRRLLREELSPAEIERLDDAVALQGVRKFAARIKCAQIAWEALDQAIKKVL